MRDMRTGILCKIGVHRIADVGIGLQQFDRGPSHFGDKAKIAFGVTLTGVGRRVVKIAPLVAIPRIFRQSSAVQTGQHLQA